MIYSSEECRDYVGNQLVKTLLGSPSLARVFSCGKGVFAYSRFKSYPRRRALPPALIFSKPDLSSLDT